MCFYIEHDGTADIYEESVVKTRRERQCDECYELIPKGAVRWQHKSLFEGHWHQHHICARCYFVRSMIEELELAEGCAENEAIPPEHELANVLRDTNSWSWHSKAKETVPGYARKLGLLRDDGTPLELREIPRF